MRRRGFSLLSVVVVLAILAILLQAALSLLTARLRETRWRGDSRYAEELARSGVDWAKACLAAGDGAGGCAKTLTVEGGEIRIQVTDGTEGFQISSNGRVLGGTEVRAQRTESAGFRPPPAPAAPPAEPDPGSGPRRGDPASAGERKGESATDSLW